ncbi:DciA family protein, partial [Streptomyces katrae]|uniref:DciA family protein n=1 Tax=Streptomyces katrae TaxID=68223 RepID=UPI00146FFB77
MDFRSALREVLQERGWAGPAQADLLARWPEIMGPDLALRLPVVHFEAGQLVLQPDSRAWETQARLLAPLLMQRLNQELGENSVRFVRVLKAQPGPLLTLTSLDEPTRVLHRSLRNRQDDEAVTGAVRRQSAAVPREP